MSANCFPFAAEMALQPTVDESAAEFVQRVRSFDMTTTAWDPLTVTGPAGVHQGYPERDLAKFKTKSWKLFSNYDQVGNTSDEEERGFIWAVSKHHNENGVAGATKRLKEEILGCAAENNITGGKWMIWLPKSRLDAALGKILPSFVAGALGTHLQVERQGVEEYMIAIHCTKCWEGDKVWTLADGIDDTGISTVLPAGKSTMYFKPHAYSILYLSSGNEFGIKTGMAKFKLGQSTAGEPTKSKEENVESKQTAEGDLHADASK